MSTPISIIQWRSVKDDPPPTDRKLLLIYQRPSGALELAIGHGYDAVFWTELPSPPKLESATVEDFKSALHALSGQPRNADARRRLKEALNGDQGEP